MLPIGEIDIVLLSDGITYMDAGGPFGLTPRALYRKYLEPDENNTVPMVLTCLLVRAAGKTIVVDTGLGEKLTDKMKQNWGFVRPDGAGLIAGLARYGLRPEDVDIVINTHLHGDHCTGNTVFTADSSGVTATFPRAQYYVQRREYQDAMHPNERTRATYFPVNYQPLVESGQMTLLDGDTEIVPGVFHVVTPGHTPGHASIRFESNGQHGLFVADMASFAVHFERLAWMTAYDVEPLVTLETKRKWQAWALETNALLIFQHDPNIHAGHLVREGDRMKIEPIRITYSQ